MRSVMSVARRNWAYAVFLWLSLATVLVPALGSSGSPLQPGEGSAFSAFTSDVSLGPSRAASLEQQESVQPTPGDGADGSAFHAGHDRALSTSGPALALPASGRGFASLPPPRRSRIAAAGPIGARAPPGG
jgi:hypothetical protein